jgi:hypothetical protein
VQDVQHIVRPGGAAGQGKQGGGQQQTVHRGLLQGSADDSAPMRRVNDGVGAKGAQGLGPDGGRRAFVLRSAHPLAFGASLPI